jgi:hypothetical protein
VQQVAENNKITHDFLRIGSPSQAYRNPVPKEEPSEQSHEDILQCHANHSLYPNINGQKASKYMIGRLLGLILGLTAPGGREIWFGRLPAVYPKMRAATPAYPVDQVKVTIKTTLETSFSPKSFEKM